MLQNLCTYQLAVVRGGRGLTHLGGQEVREPFTVEPWKFLTISNFHQEDDGGCNKKGRWDITMDVVDGISLPGERVDEHPCASCHSRLGDLGEGQGEQGFHHC